MLTHPSLRETYHGGRGKFMTFELQKSEKIRKYEAVLIMHPEASEDDHKSLFDKNKSIIESYDGAVHHRETWGKRTLANPIKKNALGHYFYTTFEARPDVILELERTMKINDKVLRFLNVKIDDDQDLSKHVKNFHEVLAASELRRKEFEEKISKKRVAFRKPG